MTQMRLGTNRKLGSIQNNDISSWFGHSLYSPAVQRRGGSVRRYRSSQAHMRTELFVHAVLSSPADLQRCLKARAVVSRGKCSWTL